ncbi:S-adenosyl-L-methionine-dependent methyltransferase superfamily protein [Forsythia ovata]|uniref:S-adenosyl-L-methionine-dependent methyltransferase superfamily protein n=1 Tax=Forsythia ovata TaxID=205694 RepID=A0ABD1WPK5_9LAMI
MEKYERDAKKYWDIFYKRHQDKFFKDRHYLDKEWGSYFSGAGRKVILEVGCGAGNTIFPLLAAYPDIFIHACDFSPRAVNLVKMHKDFAEARVNAFVCDLTVDDISQQISPSSVDIVTMVFVLSAVAPEKMPVVLQNIRKILKPDGYVLFRDYATGDLAQERFTCKEQKICENFYVRGDGTRAFYFSDEFLRNLFKESGFNMEEHVLCCKQVENRSREIVMNRRWVQAVFKAAGGRTGKEVNHQEEDCSKPKVKDITWKDATNRSEIDLSEGMGIEMLGISSSSVEITDIIIRDDNFKIKVLSKEYQHTCKSTGLMLWESARLMASVLASNPTIVAGKRVLEMGCGCGGICSMVAARSADLVVATDGDTETLNLLMENIALNLKSPSLARLITKKVEWGNKNDIDSVKQLNEKGFEVILGTDVTYVPEAVIPLFATARELISSSKVVKDREPALILCHVLRRVDEPSILSAAYQFGFRLVDRWPEQTPTGPFLGMIKSWFSNGDLEVPTAALTIMYFQLSTSD